MKERIKWAFFLLLFTGYFTAAWAQADFKKPEYRAQSIYIYNFTKYIQWPEDYNTGDFVIGVVGETGLVQELQKLAQEKTVNGRPIVIKRYANLDQMDRRCSILYLAYDSSNLLSTLLQKTNGSSTLVITQKDGLGRVGSLINFVSVNGKPKFEINVGALEKGKLRCAQQLMTIAIVI